MDGSLPSADVPPPRAAGTASPMTFARRAGEIVHVRDVANGNACNCHCLDCGAPLTAKHGTPGGNIAHFAHQVDQATCTAGFESALHYAAKHLVAAERRLFLPRLDVQVTLADRSGRHHTSDTRALVAPQLFEAEEAATEVAFGDVRADTVLYRAGHPLLIEIAVTHFVDEQKRAALSTLGLSVIEVELAELPRDVDLAGLRAALFEPGGPSTWVFHRREGPVRAELMAALRERVAHVNAELVREERARAQLERQRRRLRAPHEAALGELMAYTYGTVGWEQVPRDDALLRHEPLMRDLERKLSCRVSEWPQFITRETRFDEVFRCPPPLWKAFLYLHFIHQQLPADDSAVWLSADKLVDACFEHLSVNPGLRALWSARRTWLRKYADGSGHLWFLDEDEQRCLDYPLLAVDEYLGRLVEDGYLQSGHASGQHYRLIADCAFMATQGREARPQRNDWRPQFEGPVSVRLRWMTRLENELREHCGGLGYQCPQCHLVYPAAARQGVGCPFCGHAHAKPVRLIPAVAVGGNDESRTALAMESLKVLSNAQLRARCAALMR